MVHRILAWIYVVAVLLVVGAALVRHRYSIRWERQSGAPTRRWPLVVTRPRLQPKAETETIRSNGTVEGGSSPLDRGASPYDFAEPFAHRIKAIFQMIIAIAAVCVVGWQFFDTFPARAEAAKLLLDGIGVGLAAAAVVELAYTLFTSGPDEALDPLMLGLSAAILIELGKLSELTVAKAGALLLLGVLLAVLFATRLMLAERHGGSRPTIWWVNRTRRLQPHQTAHIRLHKTTSTDGDVRGSSRRVVRRRTLRSPHAERRGGHSRE